jgi:hypothetical protein
VGAACTNTSGFPLTQPLLGNLGDSGRDQLRLASFVNADLGVYKDTRVRENLTLQFRWETYNLFNHPNFQQPDNFINDGSFFGQSSAEVGRNDGTTGARQLQFGMKLHF